MKVDRVTMQETINRDGLARLINLKLTRLNHANRSDAAHAIKGMIGAYDVGGHVINQSLDSFYACSTPDIKSH